MPTTEPEMMPCRACGREVTHVSLIGQCGGCTGLMVEALDAVTAISRWAAARGMTPIRVERDAAGPTSATVTIEFIPDYPPEEQPHEDL